MTGLEGSVVLVAAVGAATGSRAAAAAIACAGSGVDSCGLMIELGAPRRPRPSLLATAAARTLEERLATHLPEHHAASRGRICRLSLPPSEDGVEALTRALPLCRESIGVVHMRPSLLQVTLGRPSLRPTSALLRADLGADRSLVALAIRDLQRRGIAVSVLKRPLTWLSARLALAGALGPEGCASLPLPPPSPAGGFS